ncbi:MAG: glycosyltransferase family 4 protein [Acidimicrobiia bacterium]
MVGIIASFVIAVGWAALSTRLGPRIGFVDNPGGDALKIHKRPVPPLGGIGIFAGVHTGMFLEGIFDPGLFLATASVLVLGLADDRIGLSPRFRLGAEVAAAALLVGLVTTAHEGPAQIGLGVLFVVIAVNAVNLLDGLDGLVGSVVVVSGLGLAGLGLQGASGSTYGLVLAAGALGFLMLNWHPARVFLGDNGAYTIGMLLAYAVVTHPDPGFGSKSLLAMGIMGVFFIDLGATLFRRAANRERIFVGDRRHLYDQLRDREWSIRGIATFAALVQTILAALFLGLLAAGGGSMTAVVSIGLVGGIILALLWRFGFLQGVTT